MSSPLDKKSRKSRKSFKCGFCDYITSRKNDWNKHLLPISIKKMCHQMLAVSKKVAEMFRF